MMCVGHPLLTALGTKARSAGGRGTAGGAWGERVEGHVCAAQPCVAGRPRG